VSSIAVRPVHERDLDRAGDVNFVAFYHVAVAHGLSPSVTTPEESRRYLRHLLRFDPMGGLVAEESGEVVGVAWVHVRGPVATIGPLAVDPRSQGRGIGRLLLDRCIEAAGAGVPQVRLVNEGFNRTSLGLYLRAGFRVVAPLLYLELPGGTAVVPPALGPGTTIRRAGPADAARIVQRDARVFGAPRPQSVDLYLGSGRALVAERGTMLAGYALGMGLHRVAHLGSASADDLDVLLPLLATLAGELALDGAAVRLLVPATDRRLVDALVGLGFRVFLACHYMGRGGGTAPPANYVLMNGDMM
jgi:GNAT superfamily N-acetyltransferase